MRLNSNRNSKKRNLILIDRSKESTYYAYSKYNKSIKFSVTHQKLRVYKNLPDFKRGGTPPPPQKNSRNVLKNHIWFSVSGNFIVDVSNSHLKKCGTSYFCQITDHGGLFFFRDDRIEPIAIKYREGPIIT